MTIAQLSKHLPDTMDSRTRSILLTHFSDLQRETELWHNRNLEVSADLAEIRNKVDALQETIARLTQPTA